MNGPIRVASSKLINALITIARDYLCYTTKERDIRPATTVAPRIFGLDPILREWSRRFRPTTHNEIASHGRFAYRSNNIVNVFPYLCYRDTASKLLPEILHSGYKYRGGPMNK